MRPIVKRTTVAKVKRIVVSKRLFHRAQVRKRVERVARRQQPLRLTVGHTAREGLVLAFLTDRHLNGEGEAGVTRSGCTDTREKW